MELKSVFFHQIPNRIELMMIKITLIHSLRFHTEDLFFSSQKI